MSKQRVAKNEQAYPGTLRFEVASFDAFEANIEHLTKLYTGGEIDTGEYYEKLAHLNERKEAHAKVALHFGTVIELESLEVSAVHCKPSAGEWLKHDEGFWYRTGKTARNGRVMWYHPKSGGYCTGRDFFNHLQDGWAITAIIDDTKAPLPSKMPA